jgi:hypothetical protein
MDKAYTARGQTVDQILLAVERGVEWTQSREQFWALAWIHRCCPVVGEE